MKKRLREWPVHHAQSHGRADRKVWVGVEPLLAHQSGCEVGRWCYGTSSVKRCKFRVITHSTAAVSVSCRPTHAQAPATDHRLFKRSHCLTSFVVKDERHSVIYSRQENGGVGGGGLEVKFTSVFLLSLLECGSIN